MAGKTFSGVWGGKQRAGSLRRRRARRVFGPHGRRRRQGGGGLKQLRSLDRPPGPLTGITEAVDDPGSGEPTQVAELPPQFNARPTAVGRSLEHARRAHRDDTGRRGAWNHVRPQHPPARHQCARFDTGGAVVRIGADDRQREWAASDSAVSARRAGGTGGDAGGAAAWLPGRSAAAPAPTSRWRGRLFADVNAMFASMRTTCRETTTSFERIRMSSRHDGDGRWLRPGSPAVGVLGAAGGVAVRTRERLGKSATCLRLLLPRLRQPRRTAAARSQFEDDRRPRSGPGAAAARRRRRQRSRLHPSRPPHRPCGRTPRLPTTPHPSESPPPSAPMRRLDRRPRPAEAPPARAAQPRPPTANIREDPDATMAPDARLAGKHSDPAAFVWYP